MEKAASKPSADWLEAQKEALLANRAARVLQTIEEWQPATQAQAEVARKEGHYLRTHLRRMRYATFAQSGYDIGRGVAEASCKHVVQARLKQAGRRWSESGAEAMLHQRTAWRSAQQADLMQAARGAMGFA